MRDRGVRRIALGLCQWPGVYVHARRRGPPCDLGPGHATLRRREVHVVAGHLQVAGVDPQLREAGVEIEQRRVASHARQRRRRVVAQGEQEVQRTVEALEGCPGPRLRTLVVEQKRVGEAMPSQIPPQGIFTAGQVSVGEVGRNRLEPRHVGARAAQPQRPIDVDPPVAAAVGIQQRIGQQAHRRRHRDEGQS